ERLVVGRRPFTVVVLRLLVREARVAGLPVGDVPAHLLLPGALRVPGLGPGVGARVHRGSVLLILGGDRHDDGTLVLGGAAPEAADAARNGTPRAGGGVPDRSCCAADRL